MPNDLNPSNLFNPMMLWTDLGMRALEMTVSSTQNISEGLDRLTRATATPEDSPASAEASGGRADRQPLNAASGLAFTAEMQRATFDLMTQAWQQWMKTIGMLVSMGAGRGFSEAVARQAPLLKTMQEGFAAAANAGSRAIAQASPARSERQQGGGRQRERGVHDMEHAFGAAETKRRSRSGGRAKAAKTKSRGH